MLPLPPYPTPEHTQIAQRLRKGYLPLTPCYVWALISIFPYSICTYTYPPSPLRHICPHCLPASPSPAFPRALPFTSIFALSMRAASLPSPPPLGTSATEGDAVSSARLASPGVGSKQAEKRAPSSSRSPSASPFPSSPSSGWDGLLGGRGARQAAEGTGPRQKRAPAWS